MFGHDEFKQHRGARIGKVVVAILGGLVLATAIGLGVGFLVKFLWNVTIAEIFGIATITYWQAVGLFILSKLFFSIGGSGHHGRKHGPGKRHGKRHRWMCEGETPLPEASNAFKDYWQAEGKDAYQSYQNKKEDSSDNG